MTSGRISASANSRTDLRSWICSCVYSKSTSDDFFRMLHSDIHGVRPLAAVLPQVNAAHHVYGFGNLQLHHLVPEGKLMAHVLINVPARIIPEESPVRVPVRIELVLRGLAQKRL